MATDTIAPPPPTLSLSKNAAGYVLGNTPFIAGIAEANATIQVFSGGNVIGTTLVDPNGFWNVTSVPLGDGVGYVVSARAVDAAGNVSAPSASLSFNIDSHAPLVPTGKLVTDGGALVQGNQAVFSGTGEAGSVINLIGQDRAVVGRETVRADGSWAIRTNPIPDGYYEVTVQSVDQADNASVAGAALAFFVDSALNRTGTPGPDLLIGDAGNNALAGLGGIDTALYAGARADFTVGRSTNGFTISSDGSGFDSLLGVERIRFIDTAVALDIAGNGGQAYRLYKAAFDRTPDPAGVGYWMDRLDNGASIRAVADAFIASAEFTGMLGPDTSTAHFVDYLYHNVLHRQGDAAGFDFWVNAIDARNAPRALVLTEFSQSPENQAQVIGSIQAGFEYTPFGSLG